MDKNKDIAKDIINSIVEFESLTYEQNMVVHDLIETAMAGATLEPEYLKTARDVLNTLTREQISIVYALIAALSHGKRKNTN